MQYKQFWTAHKGCGIGKSAMDLITRMLHFEPEKRITISQIKSHPWYKGEVLEQERLVKVLRLRHMQMQLKRSRDPIKIQLLQTSERKSRVLEQSTPLWAYLQETNKDISEPAPSLPSEESIGVLDSFTEVYGFEVLNYFSILVIENEGNLFPDFANFSVLCVFFFFEMYITTRMAIQSMMYESAECAVVEIVIRVYWSKQYACNVVKYHRMSGNILHFRSVLQFLQKNSSAVLTGLPETQGKISRNEQDLQLLQKYFPEPLQSSADFVVI
ncbi:hypothetical protein RFI_13208 [Reticulomyxa filosa]|uniref:Protein kinase domain-containing protein n=1 Tax=Reticulomyxa filosa TaxID=46433 RepID=X6NDA2_RETFI|nr:hypothetical protein RFI_13208 [Reticulomyxa filosa]|eukprot:ETO23951.1 hypothetical protein RFI_13208 [Reticulomyxa filosa]